MAALLLPAPAHQPVRPRRPQLVAVPAPTASVYRRRRVGVVLALATLIVMADRGVNHLVDLLRPDPRPAVATAPAAPAAPAGDRAGDVVVVRSGDTLWSIARSLQPTGEIRPLVDELARRAGGSSLRVGQRLDVRGLTGVDG